MTEWPPGAEEGRCQGGPGGLEGWSAGPRLHCCREGCAGWEGRWRTSGGWTWPLRAAGVASNPAKERHKVGEGAERKAL